MLHTMSEPLALVSLSFKCMEKGDKTFTEEFLMVSIFVVREQKLGSMLSSQNSGSVKY